MDKEWLKYWQKVEDLEVEEYEESELEKTCDINLEGAKDLYKSVLNDNN
ncbi:MAG: hypothetical protein IJN90_07810 [Bacilli bacterium]|nr:hypothetical protein [Bacilli bacterium]